MKRQALLLSGIIVCLLLPGCSTITIPSVNQAGALAVHKAQDAASHIGARYLNKKTSKIEPSDQSDFKRSPPDPASDFVRQDILEDRNIETLSLKDESNGLAYLVLDTVSSAFGLDRIKPKAHNHYPSYMPYGIDPSFPPRSSISGSFMDLYSKNKGKPAAGYHSRKLFAGLRWKFIAAPS